jgi:predicted nucleic acid-binding protein
MSPGVVMELLRGAATNVFAARAADLSQFPSLLFSPDTGLLAAEAQRDLARARPDGLHRSIHPLDFVLAAIAHEHRIAVLHYDSDFDEIKSHTNLDFDSRWLAARNSLR